MTWLDRALESPDGFVRSRCPPQAQCGFLLLSISSVSSGDWLKRGEYSCNHHHLSVRIGCDWARLAEDEMTTMLNRRDLFRGAATSIGAMTALGSDMVTAAPEPMMSFNVIYPNHDGARFDTSYYRSTHIPLAMKVMKAARVILIEGVPMGGSAPPYVMIAHFQFLSSEDARAALANPAMAEVRADVAKFTNIKPTVMLGKSL
jgi:uncharacterized protein (TIGR02118 family)